MGFNQINHSNHSNNEANQLKIKLFQDNINKWKDRFGVGKNETADNEIKRLEDAIKKLGGTLRQERNNIVTNTKKIITKEKTESFDRVRHSKRMLDQAIMNKNLPNRLASIKYWTKQVKLLENKNNVINNDTAANNNTKHIKDKSNDDFYKLAQEFLAKESESNNNVITQEDMNNYAETLTPEEYQIKQDEWFYQQAVNAEKVEVVHDPFGEQNINGNNTRKSIPYNRSTQDTTILKQEFDRKRRKQEERDKNYGKQ